MKSRGSCTLQTNLLLWGNKNVSCLRSGVESLRLIQKHTNSLDLEAVAAAVGRITYRKPIIYLANRGVCVSVCVRTSPSTCLFVWYTWKPAAVGQQWNQ